MPGLDREISLGEMIDLKLIDHSKTIVKSRRSNRYVSTKDALKVKIKWSVIGTEVTSSVTRKIAKCL